MNTDLDGSSRIRPKIIYFLIVTENGGRACLAAVALGCGEQEKGDGSRRPRRGAHGRWQLLAPPGILLDASAQVQRSRRGAGAEAMAAIGVRVPVIVREGKRRRRASPKAASGVHRSVIVRAGNDRRGASPEGASGRHDRQRQPVPHPVSKRRICAAPNSVRISLLCLIRGDP